MEITNDDYDDYNIMAITNYDYNKRPSRWPVSSHQVDTRNQYFAPLRHYDILNAEYTAELTRRQHSDYLTTLRPNDPASDYSQPYETVEIKFVKRGLEKLLTELDIAEKEKYLRKQNPALQAAWDHYQTVLGLVK